MRAFEARYRGSNPRKTTPAWSRRSGWQAFTLLARVRIPARESISSFLAHTLLDARRSICLRGVFFYGAQDESPLPTHPMNSPWLHARPLPSTGRPVDFELRKDTYLAPLPLCNFANTKYLADQACDATCKSTPVFKKFMDMKEYLSPFCQIDTTTQKCIGYPDYNTGPSPQLMTVPPCVSCPSSDQQVAPRFQTEQQVADNLQTVAQVDITGNFTSLMYNVPLTERSMNEAKRVCRAMPNCEGFMVITTPGQMDDDVGSITFGQIPQGKPTWLQSKFPKGVDVDVKSYVLPDRISTVPPTPTTTQPTPTKPACWEGTTPLLHSLCAYRSSVLESQGRTDSDLYKWADASGNALCRRSNASGCSYDKLS